MWGPLSELDVGQGSRLDNNTAALSGGAVMVGATLDLLSLTVRRKGHRERKELSAMGERHASPWRRAR